MRLSNILTGLFLMTVIIGNAQQFPTFNNFKENKYAVNPAFAGSENYTPVRLMVRSNTSGVSGNAPETALLSAHTKKENYGLGGILINDKYGNTRQFGAAISYAYHLNLTEDINLSFGLSASAYQFSITQTDYMYFDLSDDALTGGYESSLVPNVDFGMAVYASNYYFGFSAMNLIEPELTLGYNNSELNTVKRYFNVVAGYKIEMNDLNIEPGVRANISSEIGFIGIAGVQLSYKNTYLLNVDYKMPGAVAFGVGFKKNKYYLAYNFELPMSTISSYISNTHEIVLGLNIPQKEVEKGLL